MHAVFEATVFEKTEADLLGSPRTLQWIRSWRASFSASATFKKACCFLNPNSMDNMPYLLMSALLICGVQQYCT